MLKKFMAWLASLFGAPKGTKKPQGGGGPGEGDPPVPPK